MDMAAALVGTWLLARDACIARDAGVARDAGLVSEFSKTALVQAFAAEHLPKAEGSGAAILALDMSGIAAKESILV